MTEADRETLWERLNQEGLTVGSLPEQPIATSPWFVRLMLGVAGWLGAMFLFSFLALMFQTLLSNSTAAFVLGVMICGFAAWLFRAYANNDFADQFGFATSLLGQALILVSLATPNITNVASVALVMVVVETVLFFMLANYLHRVWSAWMALFALNIAMGIEASLFMPVISLGLFSWVWLQQFSWPSRLTWMRAAGYGSAIMMLELLFARGLLVEWAGRLGGNDFQNSIWITLVWLGAALQSVIWLLVVQRVLVRNGIGLQTKHGRLLFIAGLLLALIALKVPGLAMTSTMLVLGFANGNRVLLGLGLAALLAALARYYYLLNMTLLAKSAWLMLLGVTLLLLQRLLTRLWPKEVDGA